MTNHNKYIKLIFDIFILTYIIKNAGIELTLILIDNNYQMIAIIWSWIVGYYVVSKMVNIIEKNTNRYKGEMNNAKNERI